MGGDPDILVDLTTARSAFEAEAMVQALRAAEIPAEAFTMAASMLQGDIYSTQPFRVQVRRRDVERASEVLRNLPKENTQSKWEDIDTGDRTPVTEEEKSRMALYEPRCPKCGYSLSGIKPARCPECGAVLEAGRPDRSVPRPSTRPIVVIGWLVLAAAALTIIILVVIRNF